MKSKHTAVLSLAIVAALVAGPIAAEPAQALSQKAQGKAMTQALKQVKKGNYAKAAKTVKKLPATASEPCTKKMSKSAKKAFKKVVKGYRLDPISIYAKAPSKGWLQDFYLSDVNNDGKADLILKTGTCEADYRFTAYIYDKKKGKAVKYASSWAGHAVLLAYPKHKGLAMFTMHQGYAGYGLTLNKKAATTPTMYGSVADADLKGYCWFCNQLKSHVVYKNGMLRVKWGELK